MFENVEFSSRYGPTGPPSALRLCRGPCKGMGFYPCYAHEPDNPHACRPFDPPTLTALEAAEVETRIANGLRQADGYYFLRCPGCNGSGRVSYVESVLRVPRWFCRAVAFCWTNGPSRVDLYREDWSYRQRAWFCFKVAFLADLGWRL